MRRVNGRPHIATLFAIAVILSSFVNLWIIYVVTSRPRAIVQEVVHEAVASGEPTTMPRPARSLDDATRRGDVASVKQHMYWCRKDGNCDLQKELKVAVDAGQPTVARVLLAAGANVNAAGAHAETALHSAVIKGGTNLASVLLAAGANVNARDEDGMTPLHAAAAWGHVELARMLLAAGADANALDRNRQTPLHLVASRRVPPLSVYADVAKTLLDAGAKPNIRAADGSTALRVAEQSASSLTLDGNAKASGDANEVVALLREHGGVD
ncbi:MAG TPA: ankyrin repeat domain-containing protein [Candidatus Binatia bacterium]|jgi:ankyrin repeat protein